MYTTSMGETLISVGLGILLFTVYVESLKIFQRVTTGERLPNDRKVRRGLVVLTCVEIIITAAYTAVYFSAGTLDFRLAWYVWLPAVYTVGYTVVRAFQLRILRLRKGARNGS